jgi:hypothetical protein
MKYGVTYILYAGTKIVEADSAEGAREIVEGMSDDELMDGAEIDDIVQDVELLDDDEDGDKLEEEPDDDATKSA